VYLDFNMLFKNKDKMHTSMIYHYAALAWEARPTLLIVSLPK